ncbi:MAG: GGDEF domain-containing response regulator, partial [Sphingomonadales bacterium]
MQQSYRQVFSAPGKRSGAALGAMAAELFGDDADGPAATPETDDFDCTYKMQGLDAVAAVEESIASGERYAVAFIDVRMPPGIDGKETARRIRALDPDINLVIVTGYSDFSPIDISRAAGPADKIFYIAKPFQAEEVMQTATALSNRWRVDAELRSAMALLEEQKLELAANESRAIHMASHDSLTDAPNRLAFLHTLGIAVKSDQCFATAMMDLDRFKLVNDTLGHLAGDEMLRMVCGILQSHFGEDGMVARLGGDEFAMLFPVGSEDQALMLCERVLKDCSVSFKVMGHSVQGGASIGVVLVEPGSTGDPVDVMRRADLALNEAKRQGRGCVRVFDESMDESIRFRRQIETGLSGAIERGELRLVFQPIVGREGLEIDGFEALIRWCSPEYGLVSPALFIPIAEESNLIHELGDWVIDEAVRTLKTWPGQYVSVNFSPRQFRRHNFV